MKTLCKRISWSLAAVFCLAAGQTLQAQKISALTTVTRGTNTDLLVLNIFTNGGWITRSIATSNLLDVLKSFNNWPAAGGGGGAGITPVINLVHGTNVNVGNTTNQSVITYTNGSFKFTFTGSAVSGETIQWAVANTNGGANLYTTNTTGIRDLTSPTNLLATTFFVPSNSIRVFTFKYNGPASEWQLWGNIMAGLDIAWPTGSALTNNGLLSLLFSGTGAFAQTNGPTLNNPTFIGDPLAPTPTASDNDTSVATTAFVSQVSSNRVRVAAGTGGITVTPSGSGGVETFTVSDDDAGGGGGGASTNEIDFTIAIIPDTQSSTSIDSNIFWNAMQHLKTNATALNLRAVIGEGDIVQTGGTLLEWTNGVIGWGKIYSNDIPVLVPQGNHDFDENGTIFIGTRALTNFNTYFGTNYYRAKSWFNGDFYGTSNHAENAYFFLTNGPSVYGFMQLEFGPRTNVMNWATNVIGSNNLVHWFITTHSYLYRDNSRVDPSDLYDPKVWQCCTNAADGEDMWNYFVKSYPNIVAVFSGHDLGDGQGRLAQQGTFGNVVSQYLFNYQVGTDDNGVSGRYQILRFRPQRGLVQVQTYSPVTDTYTTTSEFEFGFPIALADNRTSTATQSHYIEEFWDDSAGFWTAFVANSGTTTWAVDPPVGGLFGWSFIAAASVSNGAAGIYIPAGSSGNLYFGTDAVESRWRIYTPALSASTTVYTLVVGYGDTTSATEPVDGAYFWYTHSFFGGNWGAKTSNNSTRSSATNGTPVAVTGSALWDLRIVATSSQVDFYVSSNKGSTWTLIGSSTSNIPSAAGREFTLESYIVKQGGSVGTDYRGYYIERLEYW